MANPMFSKDGLKCHLKRRKQFFEENMNFSKKHVCYFASLVLYIFLNIRRIHVLGLNLTMSKVSTNCGLSTIRNIDYKLLQTTDSSLTQTLLYRNPSLDIITKSLILNTIADFILSTKRIEEALF